MSCFKNFHLMEGSFARKCLRRLGLALLIACIVILVTLEVISRGAAQIFNHAMANQDMLRGTITVEQLISDITGHVYFTNLVWTDREGNPILEIPSGDFRVNVWDVLTRDFKSTTIRELTVDQPVVSVRLSDDMKVDFVRPSPDMDNLKKEPADWREKVNLSSRVGAARSASGAVSTASRKCSATGAISTPQARSSNCASTSTTAASKSSTASAITS